jgi:hypothetical protein
MHVFPFIWRSSTLLLESLFRCFFLALESGSDDPSGRVVWSASVVLVVFLPFFYMFVLLF